MSIISQDRSRNGAGDQARDGDNGVTAKEAADFFGVSLPTFWRRVADGSISPPYYPAERTPRWVPSKLREDRERMTMTPAEAKDRRRKAKLARRAAAEGTTTQP
jgi:predicted DNA-binding transcriptional regulator AlpA